MAYDFYCYCSTHAHSHTFLSILDSFSAHAERKKRFIICSLGKLCATVTTYCIKIKKKKDWEKTTKNHLFLWCRVCHNFHSFRLYEYPDSSSFFFLFSHFAADIYLLILYLFRSIWNTGSSFSLACSSPHFFSHLTLHLYQLITCNFLFTLFAVMFYSIVICVLFYKEEHDL